MEAKVTYSACQCNPARRMLLSLAVMLACGMTPAALLALDDADPPPDVAEEQRLASELSRHELDRLTLRAARAGGTEFKASPESLLKWSNPDAGRVYGDVYVWTDQGRPAALASIYRWYSPYQSLTIEFCSLSTEAITAERAGQVIWRPTDPGIEWRDLPDAEPPAASRAARLTQMKRFASWFAAKLTDSRADQAAVDKVLRLLSRPVFRHEADAAADGALFAFVVGTDPELLLLLEVGGQGWRYALSRINRDPLSVTLDGDVVQQFEYIAPVDLFDGERPYSCYNVKDQATETAPGNQ